MSRDRSSRESPTGGSVEPPWGPILAPGRPRRRDEVREPTLRDDVARGLDILPDRIASAVADAVAARIDDVGVDLRRTNDGLRAAVARLDAQIGELSRQVGRLTETLGRNPPDPRSPADSDEKPQQ